MASLLDHFRTNEFISVDILYNPPSLIRVLRETLWLFFAPDSCHDTVTIACLVLSLYWLMVVEACPFGNSDNCASVNELLVGKAA